MPGCSCVSICYLRVLRLGTVAVSGDMGGAPAAMGLANVLLRKWLRLPNFLLDGQVPIVFVFWIFYISFAIFICACPQALYAMVLRSYRHPLFPARGTYVRSFASTIYLHLLQLCVEVIRYLFGGRR